MPWCLRVRRGSDENGRFTALFGAWFSDPLNNVSEMIGVLGVADLSDSSYWLSRYFDKVQSTIGIFGIRQWLSPIATPATQCNEINQRRGIRQKQGFGLFLKFHLGPPEHYLLSHLFVPNCDLAEWVLEMSIYSSVSSDGIEQFRAAWEVWLKPLGHLLALCLLSPLISRHTFIIEIYSTCNLIFPMPHKLYVFQSSLPKWRLI